MWLMLAKSDLRGVTKGLNHVFCEGQLCWSSGNMSLFGMAGEWLMCWWMLGGMDI